MESTFDVAILGTSLTESILAAALSKAGFKVAHIDVDRWYGGDEASLSLDELVQWAEEARESRSQRYTNVCVHNALSPETSHRDSRLYALSLCPSVIPSIGPTIASLIASGVARYGGFRLVDSISIYDTSSSSSSSSSTPFESVPCRREDVFKSTKLSLIEKRRIMRFLTSAVSESEHQIDSDDHLFQFIQTKFGISESTSSAIGYALAFCTSPFDHARPALDRIRRYIRSSGRYGPSPFLVGQYGGTGEIAQGFCRAAAVHGAVYILGRKILSVGVLLESNVQEEGEAGLYAIMVEDVPDPLKCKLLIASPRMAGYLSSSSSGLGGARWILSPCSEELHSIARCIAIVGFPLILQNSRSTQTPSPQEEDPERERETPTPTPAPLPPQDQDQDSVVLVFPPSSFPSSGGSNTHACTVLITGSGSMSTPKGKSVVYLGLPLAIGEARDARTILEPYLEATMSLAPPDTDRTPLFTTFYTEHPYELPPSLSPSPSSMAATITNGTYLVTPPICTDRLPESSDLAAEGAERVYREAIAILQPRLSPAEGPDGVGEVQMWPVEAERGGEDEDDGW
ncbi:hypothetical protein AX15_002835 [Amanita polypyramis BW_CC]|nr:hypothetical protein AX15_002835 [Amanita polypyramis BW_CC]